MPTVLCQLFHITHGHNFWYTAIQTINHISSNVKLVSSKKILELKKVFICKLICEYLICISLYYIQSFLQLLNSIFVLLVLTLYKKITHTLKFWYNEIVRVKELCLL
jgi:hypothetical protein